MRADEFLFVNGYFDSRTKAKQAIENGEVYIDDKIVDKPSKDIAPSARSVRILKSENYVSLGGYKLSKALKDFGFSVEGVIAADIGASTGGFTDCLLQNGATKVYAVDLNENLLHPTIRNNEKVISLIKNARNLSLNDFEYPPNLITADLSFISAKQVLHVFYDILPDGGKVILLIKPQFEMGEKRNFKNGIVKDKKLRYNACKAVYDYALKCGFNALKITTAPIKEDKNVEFLILLSKNDGENVEFDKIYVFNEHNKR